MDFRVLGPLMVREGDRALKLGGYRQQLVLAVLLIHSERELSTDFLIDAVWGDEPPRSARKTLQAYISRLRRTLGNGVIVPTPHGYTLGVTEANLDSLRFDDLSARGCALLPSNPAGASDLLERSLSLWRGMPFGDLGHEAAIQPEAQRLLELRLSSIEHRIDADLELGQAPRLVGELEHLVVEHPFRERFHEQLMLALYRSGRQAEALQAYQNARRLLGEELGIEPSPRLRDLEEKVLLQDSSIAGPSAQQANDDTVHERNPYKGLRPFLEADADDFFGREDLIDALTRTVDEEPLVVIVGASGSGKSSLMRAGLVPRLHSANPDSWEIVAMVPGTRPFRELARELGQSPNDMRGDHLDLLRAVERWEVSESVRCLLIIDQFEELFHRDVDDRERSRFLRNLVEAIEDPSSRLTVVATLRADFYDRAIEAPGFGALLAANTLPIVPMDTAELEAAAARPAARVGIRFEPELIAELSSDMTGQPGSLPLYQYVLTQLFEQRTGATLTRSSYRHIGGLSGALSRRAEDVYLSLDAACQEIARQVLLRSASLDSTGPATRRRVNRSEIEHLGFDAASVERTLDAFDRARLLTFDRSPTSGHTVVEVAHEALLTEWPRLRGWLDDAREDLRLHRILAAQVAEWEAADFNPDYLLSGARLEQYEAWAGKRSISLTAQERDLVARSIDRREAVRAAEESRRDRELEVERTSVRRLRWLVGATAVAVLVVGALSFLAVDRSREAVASEREARSRELANAARNNLAANPELAVLLALEAVDTTNSNGGLVLGEAEEALHLAVDAHRLLGRAQGALSMAFASSGEIVVGGDRVRIIDSSTGSIARELEPSVAGTTIEAVAVSPDGRLLATGEGPHMEVRDSETGDVVMRRHMDKQVFQVAFSPDGRMVAALAPWGDGIKVWSLSNGEVLAQVFDPAGWPQEHCCPRMALTFSPDSRSVLATTWSGEVMIIGISSSQEEATLAGHDGPVTGVVYLPTGASIVTSSFDGSVRFWDAATASELSSFNPDVGQVVSIAVSPDGTRLLTGGDGGMVKLWSVTSNDARFESALAPGHQSFVMGVAFDNSGEVAASVGEDDGVRWWSVPPRGEVASWEAGPPVAFTDDGTLVATSGADGRSIVLRRTSDWLPEVTLVDVVDGTVPTVDRWGWISGVAMTPAADRVVVVAADDSDTTSSVSVWDTSTGAKVNTLFEGALAKGSVDVSTNGRLVAVAVCNRPGPTAYVWNVASGERVFASPAGYCGQSVDLDPSGRLLAVQSLDKSQPNVRVWDIDTGDEVLAGRHQPAWIGAVRFSPDASQLLTGGSDGTLRLWDVATGNLVRTFTGHTGAVEDAGWSSDGSMVVSGSHDRTARLWDALTGETILILEAHETWPLVELVPERSHLVTSTPGSVRVWTLDVDELIEIARERVPRSLTTAECLTYHFEVCPPAP